MTDEDQEYVDRALEEVKAEHEAQRAKAWELFSPDEVITVAMGISLLAADAMFDFTGSGEVPRERKAEVLLTVGGIMDSLSVALGSTGIDKELLGKLSDIVAQDRGAQGGAE